MAIKIDYSKCYDNNSDEIGKSNAIDSITITVDTLNETQASKSETINRSLIQKQFSETDYDPSSEYHVYIHQRFLSFYENNGKPQKLRSWFYTTLTITLSYDDYPELRNAKSINIVEQNISKTGTKKIVQTQTRGALKSFNRNAPLYNDSFFAGATTIPIVETKSSEDANEITFSDVLQELSEQYSFSGSYVGDGQSLYSYEKHDSYISIKISILSRIQVYQASFGFMVWDEQNIQYDYDSASIVIEYVSSDIETKSEDITYGKEIGNNQNYNSVLFVNGNTENGIIDLPYSFANNILEEFKNGKNILSLTIPVGNFEIDYSTRDILNVGDKCTVEKPISKGFVELTNSFGFTSTFSNSIPIPHKFDVKGLSNRFKTTFTGRINWNPSGSHYEDFEDTEFPLVMKSTITVNNTDEIEVSVIYNIVEDGIVVTSTSSVEGYAYEDMAGMNCSNCVIKQYKTISEPIGKDSFGNPQLYKTLYTSLEYKDGKLLENIKLEPITGEESNIIFEHSNNIITGIKSQYLPSVTAVDIPAKIDNQIITEIGEKFIYNNNNIERISLPYTITKIGKNAFAYTQGIRTPINFPSGLKRIESSAFAYSKITGDLTIPEGVEFIGGWAFQDCSNIDGTLTIPSTFKFPSGEGPIFNGMTNLSKIIIYSDEIQVGELNDVDDFEDTGNCDIYVLDNMVDLFKSKMPDGFNTERIKSISTLHE